MALAGFVSLAVDRVDVVDTVDGVDGVDGVDSPASAGGTRPATPNFSFRRHHA